MQVEIDASEICMAETLTIIRHVNQRASVNEHDSVMNEGEERKVKRARLMLVFDLMEESAEQAEQILPMPHISWSSVND